MSVLHRLAVCIHRIFFLIRLQNTIFIFFLLDFFNWCIDFSCVISKINLRQIFTWL